MINFSPFIDPHCDIYCIVSHPFHGQCQIIILRMLWHHHHHILRIIFTLSLLTQTCMDSAVDSGQVVYFALSAALCRNRHQSLESQSEVRHVFTARLASADWHCSQPRPVSKLHSTLSPLTLHTPSDWSAGHIPPSHWQYTRAVPRHEHTRHNQVLSPPVTKDTLAQNFPKKCQRQKLLELTNMDEALTLNPPHTLTKRYSDIRCSRIQFKPLDFTACIMRGVISPGTRG